MDGFSSEGLGVQRSIQNGAGRLLELDCGMGSITVSHLEKENCRTGQKPPPRPRSHRSAGALFFLPPCKDH